MRCIIKASSWSGLCHCKAAQRARLSTEQGLLGSKWACSKDSASQLNASIHSHGPEEALQDSFLQSPNSSLSGWAK